MRVIAIYIKHFLAVALTLIVIGFAVIVSMHGHIGFGTDSLAFKVGNEGPHVFHEGESLNALYIRGSRDTGFYVERNELIKEQDNNLEVYSAFDDSIFTVNVKGEIRQPNDIYDTGEDIIAISDLEGNFGTLRDFLITHQVIDNELNWRFGKGHLVLVGDMVDRGSSTTQLLWFIYHLEQVATQHGGNVHYIIGNHEIKNLQGNFRSAAPKYLPIAGILEKQQHDLFGNESLLGKWLAAKNVVEKINGYLFTHGGLHPEIASLDLSISEINQVVRSQYRKYYYPNQDQSREVSLLTSNKTGPAWYRGYFKGDVQQSELDELLNYFEAKAVIVGHTIQFNVNGQFNNKLFAIDVKHPEDYSASFPIKHSQALLIQQGQKYRLLDSGEKLLLSE